MECPECLLRFNTKTRIPIIQLCGHTICKACIPTLRKCPTCEDKLPQPAANNKLNYSLMEILDKDNRIIDKFIKVCFVGSSGVGKSSLIRMLTGNGFTEDIATTIGYDFMFADRQINGYSVRFQLWDSAGQEKYRSVSPLHYKNSHIVVIVYNVCSKAEDNQVMNWIKQTDKHSPEDAKRILIGNKTDLLEGKVFQPLDKQSWQLIQQNKINKIQTSCKSRSGIDDFWELLQVSFKKRKSVILNSKLRQNNPQAKDVKRVKPPQRYSLETQINMKNKQKNVKKESSCC